MEEKAQKTNFGDRLISEEELLRIFSLKKQELDRLRREKGLPFVRFSSKSRGYLLSDLLEWAKRNRVVPETSLDTDCRKAQDLSRLKE